MKPKIIFFLGQTEEVWRKKRKFSTCVMNGYWKSETLSKFSIFCACLFVDALNMVWTQLAVISHGHLWSGFTKHTYRLFPLATQNQPDTCQCCSISKIVYINQSERLIVHQTLSSFLKWSWEVTSRSSAMSNIEQSFQAGKAQAEGEVSSSGILLPVHADHITFIWYSMEFTFTSPRCTVQRAAQCVKGAAGATAGATADSAQLQQHRAAGAVQQVRTAGISLSPRRRVSE